MQPPMQAGSLATRAALQRLQKPQQPVPPAPAPMQPTRQPMPGQAQAQQQRSQNMLRSAEESNLKGRQTGKFQEGLQRFGGDRTQALHYALKYGA